MIGRRTWWAEYAWLGGDRATAGVLLTADGDRLTAVIAGVEHPPPGADALTGLVLPGLVNGHSHALHTAGYATASILETAVFAASASDITDVVVGGRTVVTAGRHHRVPDVPTALRRAVAAVTRG